MIDGQIYFQPFTLTILVGLIVILLLLLASALISGSEVAYFALEPVDHEKISSRKGRVPKAAGNLIAHPDRLLATVLIANNFVNVGIVILSTWVTNNIVDFSSAPILGFIIQTVLITFFILLIG